MSVYESIMKENSRYLLYDIRCEEYKNDADELPFRVSPIPFQITKEQQKELLDLGKAICHYMKTVIKLYKNNDAVKKILDRGKLGIFLKTQNPQYLFLRPDLILTSEGFKICELETSVFGLALSDILNKAYINNGYQTIVEENALREYICSQISDEGNIAYSDRVKAFRGQLKYLAEQIFSCSDKKWNAQLIDENAIFSKNIYRAFYSSDCLSDKCVNKLLENNTSFIPTLTPQFEEKAVLALIWDIRFCKYLKKELGDSKYEYLKNLIPPTCIVGEEEYFELDLPDLKTLAEKPKGQRKFVLKKSGDSSWGEGIVFLNKVSHEKAEIAIQNAINSKELYVIQYFAKGKKVQMNYISKNSIETMNAKIRITPYYAFLGDDIGKLISIKATGCENTDYIHGATNSINTAVGC